MKGAASFLTAAVLSAFGIGATTTPAVVQAPCVDVTRVLTMGSRGNDVVKLQAFLSVQKTGYFGPLTRQKLINWQISKKIVVSAKTAGAGTTGPKTRAALKCGVAATTPIGPVATPVQATTSVASTTSIATTSTLTTPALPAFTGGGGGGSVSAPSVSPYGYVCSALGEKPQTSCSEGAWELSFDDAGCIVWACLSNDDRG